MSHTNTHTLKELNAALLKNNPFSEKSVRPENVWGNRFIDVECLNAHASDAVFNAISQKRNTSIVITADYGRGKSHIIGRIRHELQNQGSGLFVYVNKYPDLSQLRNGFQYMLADSLNKIGNKGVTQWQELSTYIVNHYLSLHHNRPYSYSPQEVINKFSEAEKMGQEFKKLREGINKIKQTLLGTQISSDPDIIKAILWTLHPSSNLDAVKWLSGQEISQGIANKLDLPTQAQSFEIIRQILDIISHYKTLVICFDELDSESEVDPNTGLTRAQVVSSLIKELFENLKCGIIVSVMRPDVWKDKIKNVVGLSYWKVSDYGDPIDLKLIDEISTLELVKMRLSYFYSCHPKLQRHSDTYYPFSEDELRQIGKSKGSTVRDVLSWCRETLEKRLSDEPLSVKDPVQEAFDLETTGTVDLDDSLLIAKALFLSFSYLVNKTIENVKIYQVIQKVENDKKTDSYLNFKIVGLENHQKVCIGVSVLQQDSGRSLGAGLKRLVDYQKFNLTRGCLVRSTDKKISSHLIKTYVNPLIEQQGGEWVNLKENEVRPLLALAAIIDKQGVDYQFTDEQIQNFITEKGQDNSLGEYNPLLREILSDPSSQIPDNVIEDEETEQEADNLSSRVTEDTDQNFDSFCENLSEEALIS